MEALNRPFSIFTLGLMTLGVLLSGGRAQGGSCDDQVSELISKCARYVQWLGSDPGDVSGDCCAVIKTADIKCLCDHVNKEVEEVVDMKKAVAVAANCGRPMPSGTQCGSYHVHVA